MYDILDIVQENWNHNVLSHQSIMVATELAKILGIPFTLLTSHIFFAYSVNIRLSKGDEFRVYLPEIVHILLSTLYNDARGTAASEVVIYKG